MRLILASGSASRARMLGAAGVPFVAIPSSVDEAVIKRDAAELGLSPSETAIRLAREKAMDVAAQMQGARGALILGCDQILAAPDGHLLDKAESLGELAEQLRSLSGQTHRLHSAAVITRNFETLWSSVESARMTMRPLSDAFIADYLAREGEKLLGCVGGYMIEGLGAQLFSAVEGNSFVVQGLPMFPLLDFLRAQGVIAA